MKGFLALVTVISLLLTACGGPPVPDPDPTQPAKVATLLVPPSSYPDAADPDPTQPAKVTTTRAAPLTETSTPTPMGTWRTVITGMVYDTQLGPGKPIAGASVKYDVLHSHFPELQEGSPNRTVTDELGEFALPVMVHDTDSIRVLVAAPGYQSYEERLVGVDLLGERRFEIGLSSLPTATVSSP